MANSPHILVVQHPNSAIRSYHVTREISQMRGMYGFGPENMFYGGAFSKERPGELAESLAKALETIAGITEGSMKQYEISVHLGEAFDWRDIGPLVLGEIVKQVYPEADGGTLEVSTRLGWGLWVQPGSFGLFGESDDGHRIRYQHMADHEAVPVRFKTGRPILDIEHLLNAEALKKAKEKAGREASEEK